MKKTHALSLAETLTTLMIIGFIAVLLVPVLNANVEKQKTVSNLKRLYSSFSINMQTVLNEANCSSISCLRAYPSGIVSHDQQDIVVDDFDEDKNKTGSHKEYHQVMGHIFANPKYINIVQQCPTCLGDQSVLPDGNYDEYRTYRLNNGTIMTLYNNPDGNCKTKDKVNSDKADDVCGIVVFDVNGTKSPNIPGKDRFAYYIVDEPVISGFLVPVGYDNYKGINSAIGTKVCSTNGIDGYNCTAKIMLDDWKIKY